MQRGTGGAAGGLGMGRGGGGGGLGGMVGGGGGVVVCGCRKVTSWIPSLSCGAPPLAPRGMSHTGAEGRRMEAGSLGGWGGVGVGGGLSVLSAQTL